VPGRRFVRYLLAQPGALVTRCGAPALERQALSADLNRPMPDARLRVLGRRPPDPLQLTD